MSTVSRPAQRDLGLDAARGVAIVAMVIAHAHTWFTAPGPLDRLVDEINDLASPLFALVMGVSAGLVARGIIARGQDRWPTIAHFAVRALLLVVLGSCWRHSTCGSPSCCNRSGSLPWWVRS